MGYGSLLEDDTFRGIEGRQAEDGYDKRNERQSRNNLWRLRMNFAGPDHSGYRANAFRLPGMESHE